MANESAWSTIVSGLTFNPNESAWSTIVSASTGNWAFPGIGQPSIVYNGITINIPIPVSCQIDFQTNTSENIGLDKSMEFIDKGSPKLLKVLIPPFYDATFETALKTFYDDWGGQKKWFDFTSGQSVRNNGDWILKNKELKPKIVDGLRSYELILWRPYD